MTDLNTTDTLAKKCTIMQHIVFSQDTASIEIHTVSTLLYQNLYFRANRYYVSYFRTVFFITANRIPFKQLRYHIKPSRAEYFSPALYKKQHEPLN